MCVSDTFADECLNENLFESLAGARQILETWRNDYNTVRPHSALGNVPPATYVNVNAPECATGRGA